MSGLYVSCGSFEGGDKSASALDEVLDMLVDVPPGVLDAIRPVFDDCYASVPEEIAASLLPCLRVGRAALVARLGHEDSARADQEACAAGETRLRSGPGWELWCFDEVIRACEVSAAEHAPVVFVYF